MGTEALRVDYYDDVLSLTIDRVEKRNALTPEILDAITEALDGLAPGIRAVELRGAGRVAFSAGFDISRIVPPASLDPDRNNVLRAIRAITECPVPVVAVIFGYAYGAGCHLAAACDMRVAAESAKFCMPPAKLGILYNPEGLLTFARLIGIANTKELFLTARPVDAHRAHTMGLANWVLPDDEVDEFARDLLAGIAKETSPHSVGRTKAMLNAIQVATLDQPQMSRFGQEVVDSIIRKTSGTA